MSLQAYWPTINEINNCIKREAETAHESVLLAVHQPAPLYKRDVTNKQEVPTSEKELLHFFLESDRPEGYLLVPITGVSGVGKSHLVRWLDIQLKRTAKAAQMHVIRIPKSASLRAVVASMLEPLKGNRYDELRKVMLEAVPEVTTQDAATRFSAELRIALRNYADNLTTKMEQASATGRVRLRAALDHANKLPAFFTDAVLSNYFEEKIFPKIIRRATQGWHPEEIAEGEDDIDVLPQFAVEDLLLPDDVLHRLGQAAGPVQNYYKTVLKTEHERGRKEAVDVLNAVVDEATRNVFKLGQQIGGTSLQDVILNIRKQLLEEGKELILLIEDFAALTGIQQMLLSICIQEGIREGRQELCTMRTALALTDGYLLGRDTILTRAQHEWVIKSELQSDSMIIDRVEELVGAYLNAARYGEKSLETLYRRSNAATEEELTAWIKPYESEPQASAEEFSCLQAFGKTQKGYWLFPFNRSVIRLLSEQHLRVGNRLALNPRFVINEILRDLLLLREDYLGNRFPPVKMPGAKPSAVVVSELNRRGLPMEDQGRYATLLYYWGDNPQSNEDLRRFDDRIAQAFRLKKVHHILGTEPLPPRAPGRPPVVPTTPPEEPIKPSQFQEWTKKLEGWAAGEMLIQEDANEIRQALAIAVFEYINWNVYLMVKPRTKIASLFWIPNARGNAASTRVVKIADSHEDPRGILRKSLLALMRFNANNHWKYDEADEDEVYLANLLEALGEQMIKLLRSEADKEVTPLAQALIANGYLLGLAGSGDNTLSTWLQAAFSEFTPPLVEGLSEKWDELRRSCAQNHTKMQDAVLIRVAAFQGTSRKTPFAIDVVKLSDMLAANPPFGEIDTKSLDGEFVESAELRSHFPLLRKNRLVARVEETFKILKKWEQEVSSALGDNFDNETFVHALTEMVLTAREESLWPPGIELSPDQLIELAASMRVLLVKETLTSIENIPANLDSNGLAQAIVTLTRIDPNTVSQTSTVLDKFGRFLTSLKTKIAGQRKTYEKSDPKPLIGRIEQEFAELNSDLVTLSGK